MALTLFIAQLSISAPAYADVFLGQGERNVGFPACHMLVSGGSVA